MCHCVLLLVYFYDQSVAPKIRHKILIETLAVTCEITLFQHYFSLRQRSSEIILSAHGNLPEIIYKLFHRLIAAHEYFPTSQRAHRRLAIVYM